MIAKNETTNIKLKIHGIVYKSEQLSASKEIVGIINAEKTVNKSKIETEFLNRRAK
jgi:hypothetical protein